MRKKLAIGGIALFLVGVIILTYNFESHPLLQVRILPPLVIGILIAIIGLIAAIIGFGTILCDYLSSNER